MRHLLAKDILKFHCVIWPALLLGAGLEVPRQLFVHGYLLMDERKMSKSLGNVIDPLDLIDVYGVDAVRFYLFRVATFGQDGSISVEGLHERYERELGNELGNLVSRTTAMIARYRGGELRPASVSDEHAAQLARAHDEIAARLAEFDITGALELVWELVRAPQPPGGESGALGARQGRGAGGRARPRPVRARGRPAGGGSRAGVLRSRAPPSGSSRRFVSRSTSAWEGVAAGKTVAASGIEPAEPLFPRVDAPTAAA